MEYLSQLYNNLKEIFWDYNNLFSVYKNYYHLSDDFINLNQSKIDKDEIYYLEFNNLNLKTQITIINSIIVEGDLKIKIPEEYFTNPFYYIFSNWKDVIEADETNDIITLERIADYQIKSVEIISIHEICERIDILPDIYEVIKNLVNDENVTLETNIIINNICKILKDVILKNQIFLKSCNIKSKIYSSTLRLDSQFRDLYSWIYEEYRFVNEISLFNNEYSNRKTFKDSILKTTKFIKDFDNIFLPDALENFKVYTSNNLEYQDIIKNKSKKNIIILCLYLKDQKYFKNTITIKDIFKAFELQYNVVLGDQTKKSKYKHFYSHERAKIMFDYLLKIS